MKEPYILLVEDELHIARGLVFNLEQEGYRVIHVTSGEQALEQAPWHRCLMVILDLMLPGIGGLDVCRRIRDLDPRLPVLILTAMGKEQNRIAGLEAGADDYLTKPFSLTEFLLRVRGMVNRSRWYRDISGDAQGFRFGDNCVYLHQRRATTAQGNLDLTDLEVRMLRIFLENEGKILSREELLASVWGLSPDTETRTLDNFIVRLRKYFEATPGHPRHFLTIRGRGYKFCRNGTAVSGDA
ncbi:MULTISPECIES: response regulator transcription factor [Syntrophotalea]|jgi:DNA-binding response OmpR family regulator|uniref:DNA-binding response regulator n=1 Tax=Syntrophotalea acetylenica TaxID=29542 RepID=A0A1L3GE91_SYNAC|nr:response regulator transcription factor [Syntrophotalea acetylenica]APG24135.1 DNA-binding response regulator [Syntrophotalea acetylenica]APG44717.1 DNA-binding response regulator [Syntrophotalea acetylenica]MDY0262883.1 response regulator transcription factor [Syntrophotalea acetylenica]